MKKVVLAVAATGLLSACDPQEAEVVDEAADLDTGADSGMLELTTDDERTLYALGAALATNISDLELTEAELGYVTAGMRDTITGEEMRVDVETYLPRLQALADERISAAAADERAASATFADEIAAEPGAERLDSGVVVSPITEGDGQSPTETDTVTVHYHGMLRDGTVFDSSVDRGEPATFSLQGVIPCWTEGVQEIQVGGKAKLLCPSDTAYGDAGRPPAIPGGAALLFEVELLGIEDAGADESADEEPAATE